jgi:hypothetical protein
MLLTVAVLLGSVEFSLCRVHLDTYENQFKNIEWTTYAAGKATSYKSTATELKRFSPNRVGEEDHWLLTSKFAFLYAHHQASSWLVSVDTAGSVRSRSMDKRITGFRSVGKQNLVIHGVDSNGKTVSRVFSRDLDCGPKTEWMSGYVLANTKNAWVGLSEEGLPFSRPLLTSNPLDKLVCVRNEFQKHDQFAYQQEGFSVGDITVSPDLLFWREHNLRDFSKNDTRYGPIQTGSGLFNRQGLCWQWKFTTGFGGDFFDGNGNLVFMCRSPFSMGKPGRSKAYPAGVYILHLGSMTVKKDKLSAKIVNLASLDSDICEP